MSSGSKKDDGRRRPAEHTGQAPERRVEPGTVLRNGETGGADGLIGAAAVGFFGGLPSLADDGSLRDAPAGLPDRPEGDAGAAAPETARVGTETGDEGSPVRDGDRLADLPGAESASRAALGASGSGARDPDTEAAEIRDGTNGLRRDAFEAVEESAPGLSETVTVAEGGPASGDDPDGPARAVPGALSTGSDDPRPREPSSETRQEPAPPQSGENFVIRDGFPTQTITGSADPAAIDIIDLSDLGVGVTVTYTGDAAGTITDGANTITFSDIERLILTDHADVIDATADTIGVDVAARAGEDTIIGGSGSDTISGGEDNDSFVIGVGGDLGTGSLGGGDGSDRIEIDADHAGAVTVTYTGDGSGQITNGSDTLDFSGVERVVTGAGDDYVDLGSGVHHGAEGSAGNDTLIGIHATDVELLGGSGDDRLLGGGGSDHLDGGDDADTFVVADGFGNDTIIGGEGGTDDDVIDLSALTGPVTVTYTGDEEGTITDGTDTITFSGIERLILTEQADVVDASLTTSGVHILAGAGDDSVTGGWGNDTLVGGDGDDRLDGKYNKDYLDGGSGDDTLLAGFDDGTGDVMVGGDGIDTYSIEGATSEYVSYHVDLPNGTDQWDNSYSGIEHVIGGFAADILTGDGTDNALSGGDQADTFIVLDGFGNDTIIGGEGGTDDDVIDLSALTRPVTVIYTGDEAGTITDGVDTIIFSEIERLILTDHADVVDATADGVGIDVEGRKGADTIIGGSGDDTIDGGDQGDSILGGAGNDLIEAGEEINVGDDDWIDGGDGDDTITSAETDSGSNDTVHGGAGNDSISMAGGDNLLHGGDGNDTIYGGEDDDTIYGEAGDDSIFGREEDDLLHGGDGNDTIDGGDDADTIYGGAGDDVIEAGEEGNSGNDDWIDGGDGNDTITSVETHSGSDDTIYGGAGDDWISVAGDDNFLSGDDGNDTILSTGDDDTIYGGAGDDSIDAGRGDDAVWGGTGDDFVLLGAGADDYYLEDGFGNDTVDGGPDSDEDDIEARALTNGVTVTMTGGRTGTLTDGRDTLTFSNFEDIDGSEQADSIDFSGSSVGMESYGDGGDDTIIGTDHADHFEGGTGDDSILGGAGNDFIDDKVGSDDGTGDDYFDGGTGNDTLYGGNDNDTLIGGAGNDRINGEEGDDTIFGGTGNDRLEGEGGIDTFVIEDGFGTDTIIGGEGGTDDDVIDLSALTRPVTVTYTGSEAGTITDGTDTIGFSEIERLILTGFDDSVVGFSDGAGLDIEAGAGDDTVRGGYGHDTIEGGAGADDITGGAGNDVLSGGDGDDTIVGEVGADTIDGGAGFDRVIYWGSTEGVRINLTDGLAESGGEADGDILTEIEHIEGSNGFGDTITTDDSGMLVFGHGGSDSLTGGDGRDSLYGGVGADTLSGGAGNDQLYGQDDADTFIVTDGFGNDYISGGEDGTDDDVIDLSALTRPVTVTYTGDEAGTITDGTDTITFSEIERLILTDHADVVDATADSAGVDIDAGAGNDTLTGGSGDDTMTGGSGVNIFNGGLGDDSLVGGEETDAFYLTDGFGSDTIIGGEVALQDLLIATGLSNGVLITYTGNEIATITDGTHTAQFSEIERLDLTALADTVDASANVSNMTVFGGGGSDSLQLGAGSDFVRAGEGDDSVAGGGGHDLVYGEAGADSLSGDAGNDQLYGDAGDDTLSGGEGNDSLYGGDGDDEVAGGDGNDRLYGNAGNDTIAGGLGADRLYGEAGADSLDAGEGADWVFGGAGDDTIRGGAGADLIGGDDGADTLVVEDGFGNDTITGGEGGTDDDVIDLSALTSPVTVTYTGDEAGTITDGTDTITFSQIERLILTNQADVVDATADGAGVHVSSGDGNDTVTGGSGADSLNGGSGNDSIDGGAGADTIDSSWGNDSVSGGEGNDHIVDWHGNDTIDGGAGDDYISDTFGADSISGGAGSDTIFSNASNDTVDGGDGDDSIHGGNNDDRLSGGAGNDTLDGGTGTDTLSGDAGNDTLSGSAGNDRLSGGTGNDNLNGGNDADTFVIEDGFGNDTIIGGEGGTDNDVIDLSALTGPVTVTYTGAEAGTITDGTDTITFSGIERLILTDHADVVSAAGDVVGVNIDARGGNDTIATGSGNDTIDGGAGDDDIRSGTGNDSLLGGAGDDRIEAESTGDFIDGGEGSDAIHIDDVTNDVDHVIVDSGTSGTDTLFLDDGDDDYEVQWNFSAATSGIEVIDGSAQSGEQISSDAAVVSFDFTGITLIGVDQIAGGGGDDTIIGSAGADYIDGNGGDDVLQGAGGDDTIEAYSGTDTVDGGEGSDLVLLGDISGGGDNVIFDTGTVGVDTLRLDTDDGTYSVQRDFSLATSGIEVIDGSGATGDILLSYAASVDFDFTGITMIGVDEIEGTSGDDTIVGSGDNDSIEGESGDDSLSGGGGDDIVRGGTGNDTLVASSGNDSLYGAAGSDTFIVRDGFGDLWIEGGESGVDYDTIDLSAVTVPLTVTFTGSGAGTITDGRKTITFSEIEAIHLGQDTDVVDATADSSGITIYGTGEAADSVTGGSGDDVMDGWGGNDTMQGGAGNDHVYGGGGDDSISGGDGDDFLAGWSGNDSFDGGAGIDTLEFERDLSEYEITFDGILGTYTITDLNAGDGLDEGVSSARNIEYFEFNDTLYTAAEIRTEAARQANTAPTDIVVTGGTVGETVEDGGTIGAAYDPSGATVATLATTDGNAGDTHSYSIVSDPSGKFEIVGNEVRVRAGQEIDHEREQSFDLTIRTTDQWGATHDEVITVNVVDYEGSDTVSGVADGTSEEDSIIGQTGSDTISGGHGDDAITGADGVAPTYTDVANGRNLTGTTGQNYFRWLAETGSNATIVLDDNTGGDNTGDGVADYVLVATNNATNTLHLRGFDFGTDAIVLSDASYTITSSSTTDHGGGGHMLQVTIQYANGNSQSFNIEGTSAGPVAAGDVFTTEAPLVGTGDSISGGSGADTIEGRGGDDTLAGDAGDDTLVGGAGDDVIRGDGIGTGPEQIVRMDFENGATDSSGNGHDGALHGNASIGGTGWDGTGTALQLDGSGDYVEIPDHSDFDLAEGTIAIRFNLDALTNETLVSRDATGYGSGGHFYAMVQSDGSIEVRLQSTGANYQFDTAAGLVTTGEWHHLAVSFGSDGIKVYVDGVQVASNAYTGGISGAGNPWTLGANQSHSTDGAADYLQSFLDGALDEFVVFGEQLNANQIATLHAQGADALGGSDRAVWSGEIGDFTVTHDAVTDTFTITDTNAGDGLDEGTDSVTGVETFEFNGTVLSKSQMIDFANGDNVAPSAPTVASGGDVPENSAAGTVAATLAATDIDGDPITYTITNGAGVPVSDANFEIIGNEIRVKTGATLNYEVATSHQIFVVANDGSDRSSVQPITITVSDVAEVLNIGSGVAFTDGGVAETSITSGGGDDTITGNAGHDSINAGGGDNRVITGTGSDTVTTGTGWDTIDAGEGDNSITAGAGNDQITTGSGADWISASAGDNWISSGSGSDTVTTGTGWDTIDAGEGDNSITAGAGNDRITTGSGSDSISASAGDNWISSGAGNDTVSTGSGWDTIDAGEGDNVISAGSGNNFVTSGSGHDSISTAGDDDTISSGDGNDTITSAGGWNVVNAGDGANLVTTGSGNDHITTGSGNDTILAGTGDDTVISGDGNDSIDAGAGWNRIDAGDGADTIVTGQSNDSVVGGDGNDSISVTFGDDTISGGGGNDTVDGGGGSWDVFVVSGEAKYYSVWGNGDGSLSVWDVRSTWGDPESFGDNLDTIRNVEYIQFSDRTLELSRVVHGTGADETFGGTSGDDWIVAYDGNDLVRGGTGNDQLYGGFGDDSLEGGTGNDVLSGSDGNDSLSGGDGDDFVNGEDGNDTIDGGAGDDTIWGGSGGDSISGGVGDDWMKGEAGDDAMQGGDGSDVFYIGSLEGNDTVGGGSGAWIDTIELANMGGGAASVSGSTIHGDGWTVVLDGGHSVSSLNGGVLELSSDASGVLTFDDGGSVTFTDIERITW